MSYSRQFNQDFNSHTSYLMNFAMKLTKDQSRADDLFQETALNAFRHQAKFRANTNMKAWLSTIMRNSFINHLRKNKNRKHIQDNTDENFFLNSSDRITSNDGEMNMNIKEIIKRIEALDEDYRIPFLMAFQGYRYNEIQEALGDIPMGTIKSRIHHARKILKHQIKAMYDEVAA